MALDPRIALAGVQPAFGLEGVFRGLQEGQGVRATQMALAEQERQQAEAAAVRQQFAQHFGARPQGLAGLGAQMPPPGPEAPVQEQQRAGAPTAMAPYAQAPPGGAAAPQGLAGLGAPFGPGAAPAGGQERAFVHQLYAVSPTGAMAYEKHLADQQRAQGEAAEAQMRANVARVEFLGRVADGVLESGEPQRAWDAGRAMLIAQGMPESQVPTVYDPSYVQQLSGMARDAKDRYNEGMLRLGLAKEQRERTRQAQAIPDYGLGDKLNAAVYATHGDAIAPGQAPTPAQIRSGRERLIAEERADEEAKQAGRVEVAAATGSSQIVQTPQGYMRVNPRTGAVEQVQGPAGALQPKPTEAEHRAQSLGERARRAHETATDLEDKGVWPGYYEQAVKKLPFGQSALSADQQRYQQSMLEFTQALLRKESGAAVTESEYEATGKTYFPQPGEKPEVLKQKQQARAEVLKNLQAESGAARPPAGPPRSPYADTPVDKLTPAQLAEEKAWLQHQLRGQ